MLFKIIRFINKNNLKLTWHDSLFSIYTVFINAPHLKLFYFDMNLHFAFLQLLKYLLFGWVPSKRQQNYVIKLTANLHSNELSNKVSTCQCALHDVKQCFCEMRKSLLSYHAPKKNVEKLQVLPNWALSKLQTYIVHFAHYVLYNVSTV